MEYCKSIKIIFSWNSKGHDLFFGLKTRPKKKKKAKMLPEVVSELYAYRKFFLLYILSISLKKKRIHILLVFFAEVMNAILK